jgi:hypothetical protein
MRDKVTQTIELARSEWSEVTAPVNSKNCTIKKSRLGLRINLVVGVASAIFGFIASDIDQGIDVDVDLEAFGISTTASVASAELIKRDVSNSGVSGFRVSVAHASAIGSRAAAADQEVAYLSDVYSRR